MRLQEGHVLGDAGSEAPLVLVGRGDRLRLRAGVAPLLQRQERPGAGELALHQHHLFVPGPGNQLHVLEVPVIVRDADPRRRGPGRQLLLEPPHEGLGGLLRALHLGGERCPRRHLLGELRQDRRLLAQVLRAVGPEVATTAHQVSPGLLQSRGDGAQALGKLGRGGGVQGEAELPEFDGTDGPGPLAGRLVAAVVEHGAIEGRVVRPGPQHAVVEVQARHLRPDQVPVDLVVRSPARGVEGGEPLAHRRQGLGLGRHRLRGVIGDAALDLRPLEGPPLLEEGHQLVMGRGTGGGRCGRGAVKQAQHEQRGEVRTSHRRPTIARPPPRDRGDCSVHRRLPDAGGLAPVRRRCYL